MEKGGRRDALGAAGLSRGEAALHVDEPRLGLRGQVRRVLAPRGVKPVQRLQIGYRWRWPLLGVDPRDGALRWAWLDRFRQDPLRAVPAGWGAAAVVWDGAGPHRGTRLRDLPTARVALPPYSPERNPAERVFAEGRRRVEGRVDDDLADKEAAAEALLAELAADPRRVTRLCGWGWLVAAHDALPPPAGTPA